MTEPKGSDVRAAYVDTGTPKCPICQMPMNGSAECHLPSCTLRVLQEEDVEARVQAAGVEIREECATITDEESSAYKAGCRIRSLALDAMLLRARIETAEATIGLAEQNTLGLAKIGVVEMKRQLVALTQPAPEKEKKR